MPEMINTLINGKYELLLPKHRAERPEWRIENGGWEMKRIGAMIDTIHPDQIVFDIGVELGDITALLAKYTGGKMVLFEPNPLAYPALKTIWEANKLREPLDFYRGFVCNNTTEQIIKVNNSFDDIDVSTMIPDSGFAALSDGRPDIKQVRLDDYCEATGIYPDVITMDVEGSEFEVIKGAQWLLQEKKPIIFMSIHPDFMYESYRHEGKWKEKFGDDKQRVVHLLRTIDEFGYSHHVIEWDYHECHICFYKNKP